MPTIRSASRRKTSADLGSLVVVEVGVLVVHLKVRASTRPACSRLGETLPAVVQVAVLAVRADADQILDGLTAAFAGGGVIGAAAGGQGQIMVEDRPQAASFFSRFIIIDSPIFDTEYLRMSVQGIDIHRPRHVQYCVSYSPYSFPDRSGESKSPAPYLGQDLKPSCGTPVDAKRHSTYIHTRRPDNGCGPRQTLLSIFAVCAALASPFAGKFSAVIPPSTALKGDLTRYSSAHWFC